MKIETAFALGCIGVLAAGCGSGAAHGGSSSAGTGAGHTASAAGSGGSGGGGNGGSGASFPEATHPAPPQVKDFGGPVLAAPKLVAVTFPGDPYVTQIDDFVGKLGASPYFAGNVKEYGVGPATLKGTVHLSVNPFPGTVDDTQIKTWLAQQIGAPGGLPSEDGATIYVLFFLDAQTVTHSGGSSCAQFLGYHEQASLSVPGGGSAPYAIVARCPNPKVGPTGLAQVTGTASHEIIESSTDPFPDTQPAYQEVETSQFGWEIALGGGEIADLCAENADAYFQPAGLPYTVQRTWSNAAAMAGRDPCVPAPAGAYFNSGAVMPDMVPLSLVENGTPTTVEVEGVVIPVGSSKTIELELFSDAPTSGPWTVTATDFTVPPQMPIVSFSFDKTSGKNGDVIHLTISPLTPSFTNTESFAVKSTLGGATNTWYGLVGN